ncbi:LamG-like jellyroll fold domain-containing protein [Phormidium tenue]|uniref:Uncharacterized protein n=1 Tax=Phormidium tenue FACHB-1050 TaxID=2692857 RepID=A0ABR8C8H7_9CYAN|nr:LamG-like jellyroll fold domain-containing protein [Phormidium tenue]MBD2316641.1 hypothetical protein [Phormidium tenue FACHB-1050]
MAVAFPSETGLSRTTDLINYNSAYTIMCWMKTDTTTANNGSLSILRRTTNTRGDALFFGATSNTVRLDAFDPDTTNGSTSDYSIGNLAHVCMRRRAINALDLIINGELKQTITADFSGRSEPTNEQSIGLYRLGSRLSMGANNSISHYYAYQEALSLEQILDQMYFAFPRRTANLHSWLPMESGSARNIDFSGNTRDFTELNTPTNADGLLLARPSLLIHRRVAAPPPYFASPLGMLMTNF